MWSAALLLLAAAALLASGGGLLAAGASHKHHHRQPMLQLNGADEYLGTLREDERRVAISPHLSIVAETGPICKYELTSATNEPVPFEIEIIDKHSGAAKVHVREKIASMDCAHPEYNLRVVAVRCADDLARSEAADLKITIIDTNNHEPQFDKPWYSFDVEEGRVINNIARLSVTDKDCGHPYGKICRFEITNALENFPFRIDDQGVLSTVRPLNRSDAESHILTIVAYDCGMQRSKNTLVTINVRRSCVDGLRNVPPHDAPLLTYTAGTGAHALLPDAELVQCPSAEERRCEVKSANAKISLTPLDATAKTTPAKCSFDARTLDLLPTRPVGRVNAAAADASKSAAAASSSADRNSEDEDDDYETDDDESVNDDDDDDVSKADGDADDTPVEHYVFDGRSNSVEISPSLVRAVVPERFTFAFTMRHARGTVDEQRQKQNIICETDDFNMNRHHFAVYIRHCKLELLLRREAAHASAEFRAAEWRWKLPEVCDDELHSYAILFKTLDDVTLMIDGRKFKSTERVPEILDDWPLHDTKQLKTKLIVGACWHGRSQSMTQFFKGRLSNMFLLPGEVEPETAIACLHQPPERLRFEALNTLVPAESAHFDARETRLTLRANTLDDLALLLQKVEYVNTRANARAGARRLTIATSVECAVGGERPVGALYETRVAVQKAHAPILSISGQNIIETDRRSLKLGVAMLPDLAITVTRAVDGGNGRDIDETSKHEIDWCRVHLKPARDLDYEYFSSPAALIASLNVAFEHDAQGIRLKGGEQAANYVDVLTKVHYFNTRPTAYTKRMYSLQCAMDKGALVSNEFFVTMTINDDEPVEAASDELNRIAQKLETDATLVKHFQPATTYEHVGSNRLQNILEMDLPRPKALLGQHGYNIGEGAVAGGAVAVVVVICVGFLLILLVVGVLKMRDSPLPRRRRQRKTTASQQPQEGMEWDDSGMNILVNPLEDIESGQQAPAEAAYSDDDDNEESSDDGESSYHEDEEFSEEEAEAATAALPDARRGLEWDDSTLATNGATARTYRV